MNIELLNKLDKETLLLVKEDAEKALSDIHEANDFIHAKSNNLLSLLVSIFILIFGYSANLFLNNDLNLLFYISTCLGALIFVIISMLYVNLKPVTMGIRGASPESLLMNDLINKENHVINILRNRIFSLNNAINKSLESYQSRRGRFVLAYRILISGLLVLFITTILFYLGRFFLPSQYIL